MASPSHDRSSSTIRIRRKHVWFTTPAGNGPISIQLSAKHGETLHPKKGPISIVSTSSLARRKGAIKLALPSLWSSRPFGRVKLALGGPELTLTSKGVQITAASIALTKSSREHGAFSAKIRLRVDPLARLLLRRSSRILRRVMPIVGLGVHLQFLRRDLRQALDATRTSGDRRQIALGWARVAADVAAIPYPVVGVVTESVVCLAELVATPPDPEEPAQADIEQHPEG